MPFTATCSRVILGGMTLAAPGATGFVALAQRAVIEHVRSCSSTVCCPDYRTSRENAAGQQRFPSIDVPQQPIEPPGRHAAHVHVPVPWMWDGLCAGLYGSSPPRSGIPISWAQKSVQKVWNTRLNEEGFRACRDPTSN